VGEANPSDKKDGAGIPRQFGKKCRACVVRERRRHKHSLGAWQRHHEAFAGSRAATSAMVH
jgi:hypothetical protein